jgi:hypothetical protein
MTSSFQNQEDNRRPPGQAAGPEKKMVVGIRLAELEA